jgi:DNA-binding transcriptional ArsR family regulator
MTRRHTPERLTLDAILPRLRTKRISKRNGERHVLAHCPAHDDANPSLSLTEKADGTLLWKCFAGCSQDAVREALERLAGIQPATARPIAPRRNRQQQGAEQYDPVSIDELAAAKRLTAEKLRAWHAHDIRYAPEAPYGGIAIPYRNANGDLHTIQYRRTLEKVNGVDRFKWRSGDTRILYGLWRLCEWTGSDTLYLCEGTSDTWTLWHADLPALGIPSATTWKSEWWREVEGFERIVLIADADKAGKDLAKTLAKTCPDHLRERVQVLQLPDGIKDANELWQREGANAERFKEALAGCAVEPVYHFITLNTPDKVINWQAEPIDLAEATPRPVEWLVKDLIPARHATNLYGDSGTGKSLIALYLALCVIEGIPFLNFPTTKRGKVLYLDLELDAEIHTLRWWAIARGAGYTTPPKGLRYVRWTHGLIGHEGELCELIEQEQPALLIVDSFGKATGKPLDPDLAIALYNLFDALPVPVLVIDHTAKPNPEIPAESAREYGTVYKRHYARSAVQVDLQGSERGHIGVILRHQKSNFGRLAPEIPLTLAFLEEDGVMLEVRLQYGGQAVQANAELFGRRGEVVRFLTERQEATPKEIVEGTEIPQGSVYRLLAQLERDGVIEAVPDAYPKRYRLRGDFITLSPPIKADKVINCAGDESSNTAEPLPDLPAVFQNRTPLVWDLIDDWLQSASNPEDPYGLEPEELDAVRIMLAYAEARGFPVLTLTEYGYTIHGDMAGWLTAAQQLAGTPAIALATRLLHALDAGSTPHAPTHNTTLRNGDASLTPSQLTIEEV